MFTSAIEDLQVKAFFQTRYPQIYQGWIIYQKTGPFEDKHIISGSGLLQKDDRLFSMEIMHTKYEVSLFFIDNRQKQIKPVFPS